MILTIIRTIILTRILRISNLRSTILTMILRTLVAMTPTCCWYWQNQGGQVGGRGVVRGRSQVWSAWKFNWICICIWYVWKLNITKYDCNLDLISGGSFGSVEIFSWPGLPWGARQLLPWGTRQCFGLWPISILLVSHLFTWFEGWNSFWWCSQSESTRI